MKAENKVNHRLEAICDFLLVVVVILSVQRGSCGSRKVDYYDRDVTSHAYI